MKLTTEITVTDAARAHFVKCAEGGIGLRLSIRGGKGCGGNEYDLIPVPSLAAVDVSDDEFPLADGVSLYIPALDMIKLFGSVIDYKEDALGNRRMDISNPNETGRCGCGKSVTF